MQNRVHDPRFVIVTLFQSTMLIFGIVAYMIWLANYGWASSGKIVEATSPAFAWMVYNTVSIMFYLSVIPFGLLFGEKTKDGWYTVIRAGISMTTAMHLGLFIGIQGMTLVTNIENAWGGGTALAPYMWDRFACIAWAGMIIIMIKWGIYVLTVREVIDPKTMTLFPKVES